MPERCGCPILQTERSRLRRGERDEAVRHGTELRNASPQAVPGAKHLAASIRSDRKLPLILPGRPHGLRVLIDRIGSKKGIALPVALELDGVSLIRDLVISRCGYSILPYAAVYHEVESGVLRCAKIMDPEMTRTMVIANATQHRLSIAVREATRILQEQVQRLVLDAAER